jgi:hypothetical protein
MIQRPSMSSEPGMFILILLSRWLWSGPEGSWWYDDAMTWITVLVVLAWVVWFLVNRHLRVKALKRPNGRPRSPLLKRTIQVKRELSSQYLRPGFSTNIHAVGIGMLGDGRNYCIQVFINDANQELWVGSGAAALPGDYRGVPVVPFEMPRAGFLSNEGSDPTWNKYAQGIREPQEVIVGGISGANTNLARESGTIGYFCTRKSRLPRRKEILLLSNSHVFADLRREKVDESDLIVQPSPGERASNRAIGTLVDFSALNFAADMSAPNHIDAAIAKLFAPQPHQPLIPLIGAVKGYVETKDVEIGETVRKFGRTTGYTEGQLFSIYLDIWIRYDRTGQSAFFQDQFLVEPASPKFTKFVSGGDSGSLLVDAKQYVIGLIFAGMATLPESLSPAAEFTPPAKNDPAVNQIKKIESYGVANPIREVLDGLRIDLLV